MDPEEMAVILRNLSKQYQTGDIVTEVLKDMNLHVSSGELLAIYGASGTGKTTLLNLISGIDRPTNGRIIVFGEDLTEESEDYLADFRCNRIGFVFQAYNLVSTLTVAENIAFPMEWIRKPTREVEARVSKLLLDLGIQHRQNHFPPQLSGGEQQRVAFARALANDPPLLLADEPTGNLDSANAQKIIDILGNLRKQGKTAIVSTHDDRILRIADSVHCLDDGTLGTTDV